MIKNNLILNVYTNIFQKLNYKYLIRSKFKISNFKVRNFKDRIDNYKYCL